MRIKILAVEIKEVKEGKKDYKLMEVSYKNMDFNPPKVEGKKLVSFASPDVFSALKDAAQGDEFDVTKGEKSAQGFVPWTRCVTAGTENPVLENSGRVQGQSNSGSVQSKGTPRSTYETPEERAKKQVYIVRQSSIANAIQFYALVNVEDVTNSVENILATAKQFEHYVFSTDPVQELIDMEDDIPL